ncbi:MAG: beta-propeller fold lactonase family protein, partial [Acidobacteriota bacterium]
PRGFGETLPFRELYRPRDVTRIPGGPLAVLPPRGLMLDASGGGGTPELGNLISTDLSEQKGLIASPDGRFLYISTVFDNRTSVFRRTADNGIEAVGLLSSIRAPLAISPDGLFFVSPDFRGEITVATRDIGTGLPGEETATGIEIDEIRSLVFAPDGRTFFVIVEEDFSFGFPSRGALLTFDPNLRTLDFAPNSSTFTNSEAAIFSPDARFLYTLARGAGDGGGLVLRTHERSGSTYALSSEAVLSDRAPTSLPRLAVDPGGLFLYASDGGGGLHAFRRDVATGELTPGRVFEQGVDDVDWLEAPSKFDSLSLETGPGLLYVASAAASSLTTLSWGCQETATRHCFLDGRFAVDVAWEDLQGGTGVGRTVPGASDESGMFWFFDPQNWEMLVKVLDGCAFNDRFWVFTAATTNVGFTLTVTDTSTGEQMTYQNPVRTSAGAIVDTETLDGCP